MIPTLHEATDNIFETIRTMEKHELVILMSLLGFTADEYDLERLHESLVVDLSAHPAVIFAYIADLNRGSTVMRAKGTTPAEAVTALSDMLGESVAKVKSICGEK